MLLLTALNGLRAVAVVLVLRYLLLLRLISWPPPAIYYYFDVVVLLLLFYHHCQQSTNKSPLKTTRGATSERKATFVQRERASQGRTTYIPDNANRFKCHDSISSSRNSCLATNQVSTNDPEDWGGNEHKSSLKVFVLPSTSHASHRCYYYLEVMCNKTAPIILD